MKSGTLFYGTRLMKPSLDTRSTRNLEPNWHGPNWQRIAVHTHTYLLAFFHTHFWKIGLPGGSRPPAPQDLAPPAPTRVPKMGRGGGRRPPRPCWRRRRQIQGGLGGWSPPGRPAPHKLCWWLGVIGAASYGGGPTWARHPAWGFRGAS